MAKGFLCVLTAGEKEVGKARDVNPALDGEVIDVTTRSSGYWREFVAGHRSWTCEVKQLWVPTDDGLKALKASYMQGSPLDVEFVDEDGYGFSGLGFVSKIGHSQPLADAVELDCTIQGTGQLNEVAPQS